MKTFYRAFAVLCFAAAATAGAGSLYSWSSGESLSATQLNANFSHIHNNMVGGHGARLVDADVASNAAISRSKIQNYAALPVAWAKVGSGTTACASGTCTLGDSFGVASVTASSSVYTVTWSSTMGDTEYGILVLPHAASRWCYAAVTSATVATVTCLNNLTGGAAADAVFTITAYDNN